MRAGETRWLQFAGYPGLSVPGWPEGNGFGHLQDSTLTPATCPLFPDHRVLLTAQCASRIAHSSLKIPAGVRPPSGAQERHQARQGSRIGAIPQGPGGVVPGAHCPQDLPA
jgi:hypothetical protein